MVNAKRWALGLWLMAGYLGVVLGMAGAGWLMIDAFRQTVTVTDDLHQHPFAVSNAALEAQLETSTIRNFMVYAMISRDSANVARAVVAVEEADHRLHAQIDIVEKWFLGDMTKVTEARALAREWKLIRTQILALGAAGRFDDARIVVITAGTQTYEDLTSRLVYVVSFARNKAAFLADHAHEQGNTSIRQAQILLAVSAIAFLILGLLITIIVLARLRVAEERQKMARVAEAKLRSTEEELGETRSWYHRLFNATSDIVAVVEWLDGRMPGRFIEVNDRAVQIWGYSREELLTMTPLDLNHGEQRLTPELLDHLMTTGQALFERVHRAKDGRLIQAEVAVRLFHNAGRSFLVAVIRDISERREAERQIVELHEFNSRIISQSPLGIIAYTADGPCILANEAAAAIVGTTREHLLTTNFRQIESWRKSNLLECALETLTSNTPQRISEHLMTTYGREIWVECYFSTIAYGSGQNLFLIFQDMTPWYATQEALRVAKHEAESANQAKSTFLANMSHEIRTPMNAIIGIARLMEEAGMDGEARRQVSRINAAARSLLAILNDILDLSKIEAGHLILDCQPFQLRQAIDNVVFIMAAEAARKGIEAIVEIAPDIPPWLLGDRVRLEQVLLNLLANAIKFTDVGEVYLRVRLASQDEDSVTLETLVRDTGIGIAPEHQGKLFQPFSQGDDKATRRYGGTGLGLVICERIVGLMEGQINFPSTSGVGSDFHFTATFGRVTSEPYSVHQETPPEMSLLLVDDNGTARGVLERMCQSFHWHVETAASAREGLEALRRYPGRARLLLLDWRMTDSNGLEMLRLAQDDPEIDLPPVILMTESFGTPNVGDMAGLRVPFTVLPKPISPSSLLEVVSSLTDPGRTPGVKAPGLPQRRLLPESLAGLRVLTVDDSPINQDVMEDILLRAGAVVHRAGNGMEALAFLENDGAEIVDVVLMDVQMPEMDGYEATRLARQRLRRTDLPIVAITANATADDREKSRLAGMNGHLSKPIDIDELVALLTPYAPRARAVPVSHAESSPPLAPALPGIDQPSALLRLGGNQPLFLSLLRRFVTSYSGCVGEVRGRLAQQDTDQAAALLHQLRGIAANLGADEVAHLSASIESALKNQRIEAAALGLAALEQAMATALGSITLLLEQNVPPDDEPPLQALPDFQERVRRLRALTEHQDFQALEDFEQLQRHLTLHFSSGVVESVAQAFDALDYPAALKEIDRLLEMLESPQEG